VTHAVRQGARRAVPAAQAHLRPDQGFHPLRHPDDPVRPGNRAHRARQDQPAGARSRMSRTLARCPVHWRRRARPSRH